MHTEKHRLAILALDNFVPFDLCVPHGLFSLASLPGDVRPYEVGLCGAAETVRSGDFSVRCEPLTELRRARTIIIPGVMEAPLYRDERVFAALRKAFAAGARLASICTGAWVLAAAGLLDGLKATTHWEQVGAMAGAHPRIAMEDDVLFVDNGRVLTSAGLASGMDLCLHMIRRDHGTAAAERCAQFFVLPLEREGGHPQRVRRAAPHPDGGLGALQLWLLENLHADLTLQAIAGRACMSARTLNRKFREQTGMPPMAWLTGARLRRAQSLLESTSLPVDEIAALAGFGSASALREHFRRHVGVSPTAWRATYGR